MQSKISARTFKQFSSDIHLIIDAYSIIDKKHSSRIAYDLIKISLSPLIILISVPVLILSGVFKVINMYQKLRLDTQELAIKKIDRS